jgi:hypothetical protein
MRCLGKQPTPTTASRATDGGSWIPLAWLGASRACARRQMRNLPTSLYTAGVERGKDHNRDAWHLSRVTAWGAAELRSARRLVLIFELPPTRKSARVSAWLPTIRGRIRLRRTSAGCQRWWIRIHPITSAHGRIAIGLRSAQVAGQSRRRLSGVRPGHCPRRIVDSRRNGPGAWDAGCSRFLCGPSLGDCSRARRCPPTATDVSKLQFLGSQAERPPSCGRICRGRPRPRDRCLATRMWRKRFQPRHRRPRGPRSTLNRIQRTSRMPRALPRPARRWNPAILSSRTRNEPGAAAAA